MLRRKIQLIAGTTYTVSLPKDWVKRNNLKEQDEVGLNEQNDNTLVLYASEPKSKHLDRITLNIDDYVKNIDQVLFAIYYLGIENIELKSTNPMTKETRNRIRKTITHMSGTEIEYEDKSSLRIKVLLDKSKVDVLQVLYRISLILESSIESFKQGPDLTEIRLNENEIDRLYNLVSKIVSLSLVDTSILQSSKMNYMSLIPSFFLISKRLENIGDNVNDLASYVSSQPSLEKDKQKINRILDFLASHIHSSMKFLLQKDTKMFEKVGDDAVNKVYSQLDDVKDAMTSNYLRDMIRYLVNIEEELVNISFYKILIKEGKL